MIELPTTIELDGLELTITAIPYHSFYESKHSPRGECTTFFACRDGQGRTGLIRWYYEWDKRDIMLDELATNQPAWEASLGGEQECREFPSAYFNPTDFEPTEGVEPPYFD